MIVTRRWLVETLAYKQGGRTFIVYAQSRADAMAKLDELGFDVAIRPRAAGHVDENGRIHFPKDEVVTMQDGRVTS